MSKEKCGKEFIHSTVVGGFSAAANYHKVRPSYTRESVEFLLKKVGLIASNRLEAQLKGRGESVTVLELGCGTGKFTNVLLDVLKDRHVRFIASDPLESMCRQFKEVLPNVEAMQCPAQAIGDCVSEFIFYYGPNVIDTVRVGQNSVYKPRFERESCVYLTCGKNASVLPSSCVDVVLAAQSVHWFASSEAFTEINRVLAPGGSLGIISNIPDTLHNWVREIYDFLLPFYRRQAAPNAFEGTWKEVLLSFEGFWGRDHAKNESFRLLQECSVHSAYAVFASSSVIANGSDEEKRAFKELFDRVIKTHFTDEGEELYPYTFLSRQLYGGVRQTKLAVMRQGELSCTTTSRIIELHTNQGSWV